MEQSGDSTVGSSFLADTPGTVKDGILDAVVVSWLTQCLNPVGFGAYPLGVKNASTSISIVD